MTDVKVIDFEGWGHMEIKEAMELLELYYKDNRYDFYPIKIGFNPNSAYVWLEDEDYNVYMELDGKLEQYFNCSECGNEGFKVDISNNIKDNCPGCKAIINGELDD